MLPEDYVDAAVIAPMVRDYLVNLTNEGNVWTTREYGKNPNRRRFHRKTCPYKAESSIQTDVNTAELAGIRPCFYCITDVRTAWAHKIGFPWAFIDDLTEGRIRRLHKAYALRLLRGIGEKPNVDLLRYETKKKVLVAS